MYRLLTISSVILLAGACSADALKTKKQVPEKNCLDNKYPDDENYLWSCQPAPVYEAVVDLRSLKDSFRMNPVGHSHY